MSLLPAVALDGEVRHTVVHVHGEMALAEKRQGQFAHAYLEYCNTVVRNVSDESEARQTYLFDNGDSMTIASTGNTDHVVISVSDKKESTPVVLEGFLVVPMNDGNTGPDREKERLYGFGFDKTGFASSGVKDLFAGNTRKADGTGKYFTFDGTGGGDMAHEPSDLVNSTSGYLQNPNAYAQPYAALTGWVYCDGIGYEILNGHIYGMRVRGNTMLVADFKDSSTVRIHRADILRKQGSNEVDGIEYKQVLGTATVTKRGPVNFSADLKRCVVLDSIVTIEQPFAASREFHVLNVPTTDAYQVVRSGYAGNTLKLTTKRTTRRGAMSNFAPHNAAEYGQPDSNYGPIDTHGHVEYEYEYFDIDYVPGNVETTPVWTGKTTKDNHSTIIKQPIIVTQGLYPTLVYAWLRTVSVTTVEETNRLYWYKDYNTGDFVRLNWSIGYVSTIQYENFGIPEPFEGAVVSGRALSVDGNVVEGNNSPSNWFYAVTNGKGDFVLRTAPNGERSDALLVSASGQTRRITNTYSVGII